MQNLGLPRGAMPQTGACRRINLCLRSGKAFSPLDVVSIANLDGDEFARGIANCASDAAASTRVLVTRDNIVLLERES